MKKILIIILSIILIAALGAIFRKQLFPVKVVHFHAGFQVYKDNKLQNFVDPKYMHEKPCTVNGKPLSGDNDNDQEEKAHLHDLVGDVVHVHRVGATWGDLFTNLKYPIEEAKINAYLNSKQIASPLETPIHAYDSLVIFIGKNTDIQKKLIGDVSKTHIQKVEKYSENCSS